MIARRIARLGIGLLFVVAALPAPALAQTSSVGFGVGGVFTAAAAAGTTDAELIDPGGGTLTLFRTTNRIASGVGAEAFLASRLSDRWRLELAVGLGTAKLESQISSDFEGVESLTLSQKVKQYTGELALAYRVVRTGRIDVFLRAGGGGFREITDDRALVDNGWRASLGGGTQIRLGQGSSGWLSRLAVRADLRMLARGGGIKFGDSGTRLSPSVFAGLVIGQ